MARRGPTASRSRRIRRDRLARRNAFGLDRFIGRKPRVTSESYRRAGDQRRARAFQRAGVPKKLTPAYTNLDWKDLQQMDPGFVRKVMRSLNSRNPFRGQSFAFHGAFTKKSDAVKKEQGSKGAFILSRFIGGREHRYIVLSPLNGARNARRKNQGAGADRADSKYAMFHGRGPKETVTVEEMAPDHLAALGDLVCLRMGRNDYQIDWTKGQRPLLAADPDAEQLYIVGGDQALDAAVLRGLGVNSDVDVVDLGEVDQIEYFTQKDFDHFKPVVYYHQFGEDDAKRNPRKLRRPRLLYSRRYRKLMLAGGAYKVRKEGIIN